MTIQVNIHEAKTHLSRLVEQAAAGEEIVIAKAGEPKARLVPLERPRPKRRQPGSMKGKIWFAPDWDSPEVNDAIARMFESEDEDEVTDLGIDREQRP